MQFQQPLVDFFVTVDEVFCYHIGEDALAGFFAFFFVTLATFWVFIHNLFFVLIDHRLGNFWDVEHLISIQQA